MFICNIAVISFSVFRLCTHTFHFCTYYVPLITVKIQEALAEHQQNAPKLGFDVDVRSLVQYNHGFAVMSTNSKAK